MSFIVITDSTCDLTPELLTEYRIEYAPMNYTIGTHEYPAKLDWSSHSAKDFYEMMRNDIIIKTTQVPSNVYEEIFTTHLKAGMDILYISCSSALSGSINVARTVANALSDSYPTNQIICIDSLISSLGQGYLVMCAAKMRDAGKSISETAEWIEANKLKVNQFGTVDDLKYLRRAGRVTASSAFFGNFFGIKPILISDIKGRNLAIRKIKGLPNACKDIAKSIAELVENPEEQTLFISHADAEETAAHLRDEILSLTPFKDCQMNYIGPIVGASVGPGTMIAFFVGKEVTLGEEE